MDVDFKIKKIYICNFESRNFKAIFLLLFQMSFKELEWLTSQNLFKVLTLINNLYFMFIPISRDKQIILTKEIDFQKKFEIQIVQCWKIFKLFNFFFGHFGGKIELKLLALNAKCKFMQTHFGKSKLKPIKIHIHANTCKRILEKAIKKPIHANALWQK